MDIDSSVRRALVADLGSERYNLWFGPDVRFELRPAPLRDSTSGNADERLFVLVPTPFLQQWLRRNFRQPLETAARQVLGREVTIEVELAGASSPADPQGALRPAESPVSAEKSARADSNLPVAHSRVAVATALASLPDIAPMNPSLADSSREVSIPLKPIARRRFTNLASFVVGESNRLAWTSAKMAIDRPGGISPLLFHGTTGVGKTHLLEAIWTSLKTGPARPRVIYLTAEQFTSYFLDALRASGLPNFRRKYRGVDVLMIDDLQFFCGKRATIGELLHTINTLLDEGRQLVFTADRSPAELGDLGRDLVNRLQGGMVCRIESPEFEVRLGIVQKLSAVKGLDLSAEVAEFVARNVTSDARALSGAINRLAATQLALGERFTLELAQVALSDLIRELAPCVRLRDIEAAVCEVFGLEAESLQSSRRTKSISHPRMLAMFLARKHTRAALSEIGSYFGGRSHSTVHSAQQQISQWMGSRATLSVADAQCSIDEAIRRVEKRLLG